MATIFPYTLPLGTVIQHFPATLIIAHTHDALTQHMYEKYSVEHCFIFILQKFI